MRKSRTRKFSFIAAEVGMILLAIVLSPLLVLFGELLRVRIARRQRRSPVGRGGVVARPQAGLRASVHVKPLAGGQAFVLRFSMQPLVIVLTAPGRWFASTFIPRHGASRHLKYQRQEQLSAGRHEGLRPDEPPFLSGVREPRRPKSSPPADAMALKPPIEPDK